MPVDFAWADKLSDGHTLVDAVRLETRSQFVHTGGAKELQFGWTSHYIGGYGWQQCLFLGDTYSTSTMGFDIGDGTSPVVPPSNGLHVHGGVKFDSTFSSDNVLFTSDGSGNVTAKSVKLSNCVGAGFSSTNGVGASAMIGVQTNSVGPHGLWLCFTNGLFIKAIQY
jgi:hypothetical protein